MINAALIISPNSTCYFLSSSKYPGQTYFIRLIVIHVPASNAGNITTRLEVNIHEHLSLI